MGRKSGNSGLTWVVVVVILGGIVVQALKEAWPLLLLAGVVYVLYKIYSSSPRPQPPSPVQIPDERPTYRHQKSSSEPIPEFTVTITTSTGSSGYTIPPSPAPAKKDAKWIPRGESINVAGFDISGGMLYVGTSLPAAFGAQDPALIDPRKLVAKYGEYTERQTNYWPSYSDITPQARHAYLKWLAEGRCHPEADIGYVFLYFYGLERRGLIDIAKNGEGKEDLPHIIAELKRLLGIYGGKSDSFRRYCGHLLEYISLMEYPAKMYTSSVPDLVHSYELPFQLRVAVGQCAVDGVPVPEPFAFAWAQHDPMISRRTPVTRCPAEFRKLFALKYRELYGDGIKLSPNKTKLKLSYFPASAGLRNNGEINLRFGDLPDVTALTGPTKKLQAVVDACATGLDAFSRYLGKNPGKEQALEAILLLPAQIWPSTARSALTTLKSRIESGDGVLSLRQLAASFSFAGDLSRDKILSLARALESEGIGVEPNVLGGAKTPKQDDVLALFRLPPPLPEPATSPAYQAAAITLDLAAAVAHADGEFSTVEAEHLTANVESWVHLTTAHRERLKARVKLLSATSVTLVGMKKKVETLDKGAKEAIASFAALIVQIDGTASHAEVKTLEKIHSLLGLERSDVYTRVHKAATSASTPVSPEKGRPSSPVGAISLDQSRIEALQKDSEKVSALLGAIFNEEQEPVLTPAAEEDEVEPESSTSVLGLDEKHSAFARILMSRHSWERGELADVASDLDIMLDGALEQINEASFDAFDVPCTEGDDPIEINPEILEKLNHEQPANSTERP